MKNMSIPFHHNKLTVALLLLLGSQSSFVFSQQSEPQQENKDAFEVITVQAQKRAQNMQEVPISITALGGEELAEAVIKDVFDLQTNVPGLQVSQKQSATNTSFTIRGVGTDAMNFGLESSVGLYVDGVYRARQNAMTNNLVDVSAVEVLRGPQGTLFGKNTPSGAILISSTAPSHDGDDGFFEVTFGNYELMNVSGAVSISAIDDILAFRVTGFSSERNGFIDDVNLGGESVNDRNRSGARVQALYTPNEQLSLRVIADYSEIDEVCCAAPVYLSNAQSQQIPGLLGSDSFLAMLGATPFSGEGFYDNEIAVNHLPISTNRDKGVSAELSWSLSDNLELFSITAYREFDSYDNVDVDFSDAQLLNAINDARQRSFSEELRLHYEGDSFLAIFGMYYFTQDLDLDYQLATGSDFNDYTEQALFGGLFNELKAGIDTVSLRTGGLLAPSAEAAPGGVQFDHFARQEHSSYAVFGQVDYQLSDKLTLTAGLRMTWEDKELQTDYQENMPDGGVFPTYFSNADQLGLAAMQAGMALQGIAMGELSEANFAAFVPFQSAGWGLNPLAAITSARSDLAVELDDNQPTYSLKLSYQPDKNTLYYASHGTGYKSGGTNTDRLEEGFDPVFDAETSNAFELGMKQDFPDHGLRINLAAHYTTVDDFQANFFTGRGFNLQNAGNMETWGSELELRWQATEDLELKLSYAYIKAEYDEYKTGTCWEAYPFHTGQDDPGRSNPNDTLCDRSGERVSGSPEHYAVLQLKQYVEITDDIDSYVLLEASHSSDIMSDGNNDPLKLVGSYQFLNLRWIINFADYDTDVIVWGRNLTDEQVPNTIFDTPLQPGKLNAFISEPATFGITVRTHF